MIRVDFYLLTLHFDGSYKYACRLIEKAYKMGLPVYVLTSGEEEARKMDELLWTYRIDSFLPHQLFDDDPSFESPILIGYQKDLAPKQGLLVNLTTEVPEFFEQFQRIAEIVSDEQTHKNHSRIKYKFYQNAKCELFTHNITC